MLQPQGLLMDGTRSARVNMGRSLGSCRHHGAVDVGLYALSAFFISHMVRSTGGRYNTVRTHTCYLWVRLVTLSG
jgi:hypothetical protein